jgi:hypothetical protein
MTPASSLSRRWWSAPALLIALFGLSIGVRAVRIGDPLNMGHQWLSAHVLITLDIWHERGAATYGFNPVYTYDRPADKHIQSLTSGLADPEGNYYYVSYPPLTFILPHAVFSILGVEPGVRSLQLFSLVVHIITVFLLYGMIAAIYGIRWHEGVFPPALLAGAIYLFMPLSLWYHMNVYFADTLVQPLWIGGLWLAFSIFERGKRNDRRFLWAFAAVNALTIYTEWLGVFAAFVYFLIAVIRLRTDRRYGAVAIWVAASTVFALLLILLQYSQIAGLDGFLRASVDRYAIRSGVDERVGTPIANPLYHMFILLNYWYRYFPVFALLAFLALFCAATRGRRRLTRRRKHLFLIGAIATPILLHHAAFFDFTYIHEFAGLKSGVFFCYLAAAMYHHGRFSVSPVIKVYYHAAVGAVALAMFLLCIYAYLEQSDLYDRSLHLETGEIIRRTSSLNETIYLTGTTRTNRLVAYRPDDKAASAQLVYYAGRNLYYTPDSLEIQNHMKTFGITKAAIYTLSNHNTILGVQHVVTGDSP